MRRAEGLNGVVGSSQLPIPMPSAGAGLAGCSLCSWVELGLVLVFWKGRGEGGLGVSEERERTKREGGSDGG